MALQCEEGSLGEWLGEIYLFRSFTLIVSTLLFNYDSNKTNTITFFYLQENNLGSLIQLVETTARYSACPETYRAYLAQT